MSVERSSTSSMARPLSRAYGFADDNDNKDSNNKRPEDGRLFYS